MSSCDDRPLIGSWSRVASAVSGPKTLVIQGLSYLMIAISALLVEASWS